VSVAWLLVGMARALLEAGHGPDVVYGTSVGALNAAWLASDPTLPALEGLQRLWTTVARRDVFPLEPFTVLKALAGRSDHAVGPSRLQRWLQASCPLERLEDAAVPLYVVATDIQSGEPVLLERGEAVPALVASSAMPGVFPPVAIDGRWLMDGSIACDTPLGAAVRAGASSVWVLPSVPAGAAPRPRTALEAVLRSSSISLARQHSLAVEQWGGHCHLHVLPAPAVPGTSPFRFDKSAELISEAYRLTRAWLSEAAPGKLDPAPPPLP
jgi:NTE family protein